MSSSGTERLKTLNPFVTKFATSMIALLACFDRVLVKGYLPFQDEASLNRFVDHALHMPRKDFLPFLEGKSDELVAHAKSLAEQPSAPYHDLQGRHRKEDLVQ